MSELQIEINGQSRRVREGVTLADLLVQLDIPPKNIAVEFNGDFFTLDDVMKKKLSNGDRVEIVRFVGGG